MLSYMVPRAHLAELAISFLAMSEVTDPRRHTPGDYPPPLLEKIPAEVTARRV